LPALRNGDKSKVVLARRLWQETTMSLKWIGRRLEMAGWTYVSNLLHERRKDQFVSLVRTDPARMPQRTPHLLSDENQAKAYFGYIADRLLGWGWMG
jgi:hypothetical protein